MPHLMGLSRFIVHSGVVFTTLHLHRFFFLFGDGFSSLTAPLYSVSHEKKQPMAYFPGLLFTFIPDGCAIFLVYQGDFPILLNTVLAKGCQL